MSTAAVTVAEKPIRRFPPPCWTQEEALALIEAYRERWYALRRGYLRTADWDSVATDVGIRCPGASPPKTSAQCRHKMEKLRQRYRAEKQRSLSYPGRFFSSWFFFESMDAMENGTDPNSANNQDSNDADDVDGYGNGNGSRGRTVLNLKIDPDSNPNRGYGVDPVARVRVKGVGDRNLVPLGFRTKNPVKSDGYRVSDGYLDLGSDEDADDGRDPMDGNFASPGFRPKRIGKVYPDHSVGDGVAFGGGFRPKNLVNQDPAGFRPKKYSKIERDDGGYNGVDGNGDFWVKIPGGRNTGTPGIRVKYSGRSERNSNPSIDPGVSNEFASRSSSGFGRSDGGGDKRRGDPIEEMVSSIKLLGEGFVKMEKMKMEMAREIEKMRMEMEMKRNELLLESQQQIVDAFVKGLFENAKKIKTTLSPDS